MIRSLACLALLACADEKAADTAAAGDGEAPAEAVATYFFGTSDGQTPDGSYVAPEDEILFIRTLDPNASTVHEEAWTISASGDLSSYELLHAVDLAAQTFTADFVTADGTMQVEGAFDAGEDWAWTAWHSTSTYVDGRYAGTIVTSTDTLDPTSGVAHADKLVYDADGANTYIIAETLTPVDQTTFEARLAEVGG